MTAQSSKGLEFKKVILLGIGHVKKPENLADNTKLIYVGMTRAKRDLLMLYSGTNYYTDRIEKVAAL